MSLYSLAICITVLSGVSYHLFQKLIAPQLHPILSLILTYVTAIVVSLCLLPFFPRQTPLVDQLRLTLWPSMALGIAIVGLEVGFLLAYRAGWNISIAAVFSNVAVALVLLPAGLLFFKEHVSAVNAVGVVLCIVGLILANR